MDIIEDCRDDIRSQWRTILGDYTLTDSQRNTLLEIILEPVYKSMERKRVLARLLNEFEIEPDDISEKISEDFKNVCLRCIGLAADEEDISAAEIIEVETEEIDTENITDNDD